MASRLERLLELDEKIRRGNYPSLEHLCESFSVKPRTIYEDIKILRERLGLEIEFDRARNGYFNANPSKKLADFDLSKSDFILLTAALESFSGSLKSSRIDTKIQTLIQKIAGRISNPIDSEAISSAIQSENSDGDSRPLDNFLDLAKACIDKSRIEIDYRHDEFNKVERFCLIPLNLVESEREWSLKALSEPDGREVSYALEQIERIRVLNKAGVVSKKDESGDSKSNPVDSISGAD